MPKCPHYPGVRIKQVVRKRPAHMFIDTKSKVTCLRQKTNVLYLQQVPLKKHCTHLSESQTKITFIVRDRIIWKFRDFPLY